MKQKLLNLTRLRSLLLLVCVMLGVSAWGADVTWTWNASSGALGSQIGSGTITSNNKSWNYTRTLISGSSYTGWTSNCIQLGKNGGVENLTLSTSAFSECTIKSVSIECSSYNGKHKVSITVGNATYLASTPTAIWTTVSAATGTGSSSGDITISFTEGTRALYIKSITVVYEEGGSQSSVAAPTFNPANGSTVSAGSTVSLQTATTGATIYYTKGNNPASPTSSSTVYTEPIIITGPTTIKAIAIDNEGNESSVTTASYTVSVSSPTFNPNGGQVDEGTELTLTANEGCTIYYTTDDTTPTNASTQYTTPIILNEDVKINAIAYDAYGNASSVVSKSFTVKLAGEIEFIPNNAFFGKTGMISGDAEDVVTGTIEDVTITYSRNGSSLYLNNSSMRFYKDNSLTFEAPEGKIITQIKFTMSAEQTDLTSVPSGYDNNNKKWTGGAESVTISRPSTASSYAQIIKITLVVVNQPSIPRPIISLAPGTYYETKSVTLTCEESDATIYYTTNGSKPTATNGTEYTGAFTLSESCTLKAVAIKDGVSSLVAEAIYDFPTVYNTITAFIAANTTAYLNLTGAQVVFAGDDYQNKSCIYVKDETGTINLFESDLTLATGDLLSGIIKGKYTNNRSQHRITSIENLNLEVSGNSTVIPEVINADAITSHVGELVTIKDIQFTASGTRYYIGETGIQVYDNFNALLEASADELRTETDADITGIVLTFSSSGSTIYEIAPRYAQDVVYLDESAEVTITAAGMATFSSTKALDFTGADAVEAYTATVSTDGRISYTRIFKVPANTGLLLRSSQSGAVSINVPELSGDADAITANDLVAVDETIDHLASSNADGTTNFILNIVNDKLGFYKANNQKVAAGKAYLKAIVEKSRSFIGVDDQTGIENVSTTATDQKVFDLQGRRVAQPQKGLYIVNGKKVIIK